jgi:hypothetical protein
VGAWLPCLPQLQASAVPEAEDDALPGLLPSLTEVTSPEASFSLNQPEAVPPAQEEASPLLSKPPQEPDLPFLSTQGSRTGLSVVNESEQEEPASPEPAAPEVQAPAATAPLATANDGEDGECRFGCGPSLAARPVAHFGHRLGR